MRSTILGAVSRAGGPVFHASSKERLDLATLTFLAICAVMMAVIAYTSTHLSSVVSYTRDIWHHLAVYSELIASPFDPMNPHVATDDPSRSYSPWTVFVAILARLGGLDQFGAIAISAILSSATILLGIFLFARSYYNHAWAPVLLVLAFFGSWGSYINHTGYHAVATFLYSASYPFAIVMGGGFVLWWLTLRALDMRQWIFGLVLLLLVPFSAALFITHQLQGLFAVGGAMGFALFAGQAPFWRRAGVVISLIIGLYLSKFWWYFDPVSFVLDPTVHAGHTTRRKLEFTTADVDAVLFLLGFGLFGLAGLMKPATGRFRLELALPLLVLGAGFSILLLKSSWISVRVVPLIALYLQIALVAYLVQNTNKPSIVQRGLSGALVGVLILSMSYWAYKGAESYNTARTFIETGYVEKHYTTWDDNILEDSALAATLAPEGATVIAHFETAFPMEATSLAVVAIPRLFAEVPDMVERQTSNIAFFTEGTPLAERCAILAKYDVQMIVYRDVLLEDNVEKELAVFGTRTAWQDMSFIPAVDGQFRICASVGA